MSTPLATSKKRPNSEVKDEETNDDCCGICYIERGVPIPGKIDSCNHYFCFVCIMEWAKHESRCPICRQRFSNVRRQPKHGVFSYYRDIKVPVRDQVYHPHGNMTTGPVDSNAELKCGICNVVKDENLIIICDLCDTASHTYCVGLGYTVPEGDWFCHDCAAAAQETNANDGLDQQNVKLTAEPGVAIEDIVRGTSSQVFRRPMASPIRQNNYPSSSTPLFNRVSRSEGKKPMSDVQRAKHKVQVFRENWNSLRSGQLRFDSKSFQSGGTSSQKEDSSSLSHGKLDDSHSMASKGRPQSTVQGAQSSNSGLEDDISKAWKMWDRVKMTKQTPRRTSSIPQGVNRDPPCSGAREKSFAPRSCPELKIQQPRILDFRNIRTEEQRDYSSLQKNLESHRSPILGEKRQSRVTCDEMLQHVRNNTTHSEGCRERPLPGKAHTSTHGARCHEERNVAKEQRHTANLVTSVGSAPSSGHSGHVFTSNKDMGIFNKEKRFAKSSGNGITKNIEDSKTEIQSLVKLNLKCLTRDKQLGVETFKVVARQATHTILAACHSEYSSKS
ncbi:hypothetical protein TSUD_193200, partial [Trifolium subterraneum]